MASTSSRVTGASANWLALRKTLKSPSDAPGSQPARKKRRLERSPSPSHAHSQSSILQRSESRRESPEGADIKNGESLSALRKMIFDQVEFTEQQLLPGKYLALDCEMVGVGPNGSESSLARVSLVNYHGAIQLDEFVRQRERVTDYRTQWSGIRAANMVNAKPFEEVQKRIADLIQDKILVGHAIHHDMKALLLSHPRGQIRDTQIYAYKFKVCKSKFIALRNLVKQEVGATIQSGEHSSVTDARATMAVYRLHRKDWEKGNSSSAPTQKETKKRRRNKSVGDASTADNASVSSNETPGGGKKGISSGLSTIVRLGQKVKPKTKWWKEVLANEGTSKGSIKVPAR
ncbi:ribonuclease H-like protein [Pluteus cervinus]|uniref:Ribonuclease H-like protein n=1 Tax=Pluteus cervinus TaxID=181527 RepID=A0ACD3AFB5_9AGAR|nr:ribonuclease H-like protein [Pluteus cervinus]